MTGWLHMHLSRKHRLIFVSWPLRILDDEADPESRDQLLTVIATKGTDFGMFFQEYLTLQRLTSSSYQQDDQAQSLVGKSGIHK